MRHLSRHANTLTQRRVSVYGFADVDGVCTHLDGQYYLANHVVCMGTDHAAAPALAPKGQRRCQDTSGRYDYRILHFTQ